MRQFEGSLIVVTLTDNQGLFELDGGRRKTGSGMEVRNRGEGSRSERRRTMRSVADHRSIQGAMAGAVD